MKDIFCVVHKNSHRIFNHTKNCLCHSVKYKVINPLTRKKKNHIIHYWFFT